MQGRPNSGGVARPGTGSAWLRRRKLGNELVAGLCPLAPEDGDDLPPVGDQAAAAGRKVVGHRLVQAFEPVAGHRGVHVVLDVVVHVPVEKAHEGAEQDGAGAEAEIGHLVAQADVLGGVAEKEEPAAVEGAQGDQDDGLPVAAVERYRRQGRVSAQQEAVEAEEPPSSGAVLWREQGGVPPFLHSSAAVAHDPFHGRPESPGVHQGELEIVLQFQLRRQHHLQVVGRMQGVLVMGAVAGPEEDGIVPADEAVDVEEEGIEPAGAEDGAVAELVKAVDDEAVHRSVGKQGEKEPGPGEAYRGEPGNGPGQGEHTEETHGLHQTAPVAALVELVEQFSGNGGSIPRYFGAAPGSCRRGHIVFPFCSHAALGMATPLRISGPFNANPFAQIEIADNLPQFRLQTLGDL